MIRWERKASTALGVVWGRNRIPGLAWEQSSDNAPQPFFFFCLFRRPSLKVLV